MGIVAVLVPFVLSSLLLRCAPDVGPVTMSAIVMHESGANAFAVGDNTSHRSYFPRDAASAAALARALLRDGHNIDIGYAQINSTNLIAQGLSIELAFEPCHNLAAGSKILRSAYLGARRRFGPGQIALAHALSAYNSGGYYAAMPYARDVYALAATLRYQPSAGRVGNGSSYHAAAGRAVAFHHAARGRAIAR